MSVHIDYLESNKNVRSILIVPVYIRVRCTKSISDYTKNKCLRVSISTNHYLTTIYHGNKIVRKVIQETTQTLVVVYKK